MIAALYEWWHMVAEALIQKMGVTVVQTSPLVTRNVTVSGRRSSVRLAPDLWEALNEIAKREGRSVHQICADIEQARGIPAYRYP